MARFLVAIALTLTAVVCLAAAKERAWQNGRLLDNRDTHYFTATEISNGATKDGVKDQYGGIDYSTNSSGASITVFENFMFDSPDAVYLVQIARLRSAKPIRVSPIVPVKLAVENKKFWFVDQEGTEYQAAVLKMVQKQPTQVALVDPTRTPAPVQAEPKPAPVVVAKAPEPAPAPAAKPAPVVKEVVKPAPAPKPEPVVIARQVQRPDPTVARPTISPTQTPPPVAVVAPPKAEPKPDPAPAPVAAVKAEPKPQVAAPKPAPAPKPAAAPKEETPVVTRADAAAKPVKDRAWQSGQLLSTVSNSYFVNINYTTDSDGATWTMVQGNDGRFTLVTQTRTPPSAYTYDNYVIESQFCAYLVQRLRVRTAPVARFPGTTALRFAVEKNKVYVLDEEGKEYETRIIKLVQRDAIDTHTHVAVGR